MPLSWERADVEYVRILYLAATNGNRVERHYRSPGIRCPFDYIEVRGPGRSRGAASTSTLCLACPDLKVYDALLVEDTMERWELLRKDPELVPQ